MDPRRKEEADFRGSYTSRAPALGAHTSHYLYKGWSPRPYEAELDLVSSPPAGTTSTSPRAALLEGVRVVELSSTGDSSTDVALAAAGVRFADLGAEVMVVEDPGVVCGLSERLRQQYHRGKQSMAMKYAGDGATNKAMKGLLESADVFLTAHDVSTLQILGLDYLSLQSHCPKLVYCQLESSSQSKGGRTEEVKGLKGMASKNDEGAWWEVFDAGAQYWMSSGLAYGLALPPDLPKLPPGSAAFCIDVFLIFYLFFFCSPK